MVTEEAPSPGSQVPSQFFLERDTLRRARNADRDCVGLLAARAEVSLTSLACNDCQRYQHATDRYGRHASPIFVSLFESGLFFNRYRRCTAVMIPRSATGSTSG